MTDYFDQSHRRDHPPVALPDSDIYFDLDQHSDSDSISTIADEDDRVRRSSVSSVIQDDIPIIQYQLATPVKTPIRLPPSSSRDALFLWSRKQSLPETRLEVSIATPSSCASDPFIFDRRLDAMERRPPLTRAAKSEVSIFESDSDKETAFHSLLAKIKRKKKTVPSTVIRAESFNTVMTVSRQREIMHLQNANKVDLMIYECYNNSSFILAGTLETMLNEYTKEVSVITDMSYMEVLIAYHSLKLSNVAFFRGLTKHFWTVYDAKDMLASAKTVVIVKSWLQKQRLAGSLVNLVLVFASEIRQIGFRTGADGLEEALNSMSVPSSGYNLETELTRLDTNSTILQFDTISLDVLVEYFAASSSILFRSIVCVETARFWLLTDRTYQGQSAVLRALESIMRRNTMIQHWTSRTILTSTSPLASLCKMIDLADRLREERDINSMLCIYRGIRCPVVQLLVESLPALSASTLSNLGVICSPDNDFAVLRRLCNPFSGSATPSIDLFLHDLTTLPSNTLPDHLIDIDYLRLVSIHLDRHKQVCAVSPLLGSSAYVVALYGQHSHDTLPPHGPLDDLSFLFERQLIRTWQST